MNFSIPEKKTPVLMISAPLSVELIKPIKDQAHSHRFFDHRRKLLTLAWECNGPCYSHNKQVEPLYHQY